MIAWIGLSVARRTWGAPLPCLLSQGLDDLFAQPLVSCQCTVTSTSGILTGNGPALNCTAKRMRDTRRRRSGIVSAGATRLQARL